MLELADRADSNSAVRKDVWVQVPPAVPDPWDDVRCRASPPDPTACLDDRGRGRAYAYLLGLYLGDGMLSAAPRGVLTIDHHGLGKSRSRESLKVERGSRTATLKKRFKKVIDPY